MAARNPETQVAAPTAQPKAINEFGNLLNKQFKPKTDTAKEAVQAAVKTLAEQALASTSLITKDAVSSIEAIVAEIDRKLSEQINLIMHHEEFKALEGTWRGLHYLVTNTETDEKLKLQVMHIAKKDAGRTLRKFKGTAWDQSPLFKKIYEEEYGTPGGAPYGCIIGDYSFDHSPPDVDMLLSMSQICAASHTPFIAAAAPPLMNMDP